MWRHPITAKQIRVLAEDWGVKEEPIPAPEGEVGSSEGEGWFQVIRVCLPLLVALA